MSETVISLGPKEFGNMLLEAMREGTSANYGAGKGYVQWVGFPGGLHAEASAGRSMHKRMDRRVTEALIEGGWGKPDRQVRNCWFQITEETDIPWATERVMNAFEILLKASQ